MHSPKPEFESGQWYLVVTCKKCNSRQAMIHDLSRGESIIKGIYNWRCPKCHHEDAYDAAEMERYEHPPTELDRTHL